jgi:pfkB family carbohydrate kinase
MSTSTHGSTARDPAGEAHPNTDADAHRYAFDYATVGHITVDELADGSHRPGGSAFYSALQAARLGLRTVIVTRGVPAEIEELLGPYRDEFGLTVLPAERTTTLRTSGEGPKRRQRLLAWAGPIEQSIEVDTAILHLAPVARETPSTWRGHAGFVGLTPQGLVRAWDARGEIVPAPLRREWLPERCDAWVLSERESESCAGSLEQAAAEGAVVAVTAGAGPTALHLPDGGLLRVPVPPIACVHDDLGAGDVFAAALFVALREGQPPAQAAAFATAAAAVRIAGVGPGAIGDRAAIEARLTQGPLG